MAMAMRNPRSLGAAPRRCSAAHAASSAAAPALAHDAAQRRLGEHDLEPEHQQRVLAVGQLAEAVERRHRRRRQRGHGVLTEGSPLEGGHIEAARGHGAENVRKPLVAVTGTACTARRWADDGIPRPMTLGA